MHISMCIAIIMCICVCICMCVRLEVCVLVCVLLSVARFAVAASQTYNMENWHVCTNLLRLSVMNWQHNNLTVVDVDIVV